MFSNIGSSMLLLLFGTIFFIVLAPNIIEQSEASRVEQVLNVGKSCTTTGSASSSNPSTCVFTLPTPHEYVDNSALMVVETSPVSRNVTASSTIATNRQTLSISGLELPNTQYNFLIDYWQKKPDVSDTLNGILRFFPLMVVLAIMGSLIIAMASRRT